MVHQGTGATCIRYGAEEARGVMAAAVEPEDVRSKLTAGFFQFRILYRRIPSQLERRKT